MKQLATIIILICSSALLASANQQELFESANAAYKEGNYSTAIEKYETLVGEGERPKLLYNLANAYYKTGDYTKAILYYEKALKHSPNDDDIQHNLNIANLNIVDKIEAAPEFFLLTWWKSLASKMKSDQWTILFIGCLWLSILCFLAFAFLNISVRKLLFISGVLGLLFSVALILLAVTQHVYESGNDNAILMAPSVSVKSAPLNSGTDLFIIHEGLKVQIIDSESGWHKICLPDNKQGWLLAETVEVI